jgi:hypothetical protein
MDCIEWNGLRSMIFSWRSKAVFISIVQALYPVLNTYARRTTLPVVNKTSFPTQPFGSAPIDDLLIPFYFFLFFLGIKQLTIINTVLLDNLGLGGGNGTL